MPNAVGGPATRRFHLGDVLSVTTGRLVSPRHMDGVYDLLGFMCGRPMFTHELPRAADECRPALLAQHPQVAAVDASAVGPETWRAWLDTQIVTYGETVEVRPLTRSALAERSPIETAVELVGEDRVVVADPSPEAPTDA